jgi:hypothetical protein
MPTPRVALYLQDAHDLRDGLDIVRYAESRGFEAVWQAESRLVRDAIVPMAAYAAVTIAKVGSGVTTTTRNIIRWRNLPDFGRPGAGQSPSGIRRDRCLQRRIDRASRSRRCAKRLRSCAGCSTWSG